MKLCLYLSISLVSLCLQAQVGINTTTLHPSAALEINASETAGFGGLKIPKVSLEQRDMIQLDASSDGTLIYVNECNLKSLQMYNGLSASWERVFSAPKTGTVVFTENFDSYPNDYGIDGNGNRAGYPFGQAQPWTLSSINNSLNNGNDYFKINNGVLELRDGNGPAAIQLDPIPIATFDCVTVRIDFSEAGNMEYIDALHINDNDCGISINGSDYIDIDISTNGGGTFTEIPNYQALGNNDHTVISNFNSLTFLQEGISGNSLVLRIRMQNWSSNEFHRIENIVITGYNL